MFLDPLQYGLGMISGVVVGVTLGLFGGGGSILAVPLLVHLVGVTNVHLAIGTSAFAVAANALTGLAGHARHGTVKWRCAVMYSVSGIVGAAMGATLGKALDGQRLLLLFAVLMMVVSFMMLRRHATVGNPDVACGRKNAHKVAVFGAGTGLVSGFFGIGGGFLIVPGLIASTGMPTINAIGSSLVAISAFGLTTAANYSFSGLVDWPLAFVFIAGGAGGTMLGSKAAHRLSRHRSALTIMFAGLVLIVALGLAWSARGAF